MATQLMYDPLSEGYKWNLKAKIHRLIGYWCTITTTALHTYLRFAEDLTQEEIEVDDLMADATSMDPDTGTSGNLYVLKDIWEWRGELESQTGLHFAISYRSSGTFGPDVYDEIVLKPVEADYVTEDVLKANERNTVANVIKNNFGGWE